MLCKVLLAVTLAVFVGCSNADTQEERLAQVREWAMNGEDPMTKKNAITELVAIHHYAVLGVDYEIGSTTGLFETEDEPMERKKRSFSHHFRPWFKKHFWRYPIVSSIPQCPDQADPSESYQLNTDSTGYPIIAIGAALFESAQSADGIFFTLMGMSSFPGDPPVLPVDPNYATASSTCPSKAYTVYSYTSQDASVGGECWLVQGFQFQDMVQFQNCLRDECQGCKSSDSTSSTVNRCLNDFQVVQVAAYCGNLPENQKIVFDRIVLPVSCSCNQVQCSGK